MSWPELNNFELQAIRRLLCLDVKEAAELVGKVSARTWQYWEAGRSKVPDDVEMEMYGLTQMRNELIENTLEENFVDNKFKELGKQRWFHTYDDFSAHYPDCSKIDWRLHQSVLTLLFSEGTGVELSGGCEIDKESYMHKWMMRETPAQIQHEKDRELSKKLGLD